MSDGKQYPTFVWAVVSIILLVLVGYALSQGLIPKKIPLPWGSVDFERPPEPNIVTFRVSYDLPKRLPENQPGPALQAQAVVYIGGTVTTLLVDRDKPFATAVVKMKKSTSNEATSSEEYSYRIEITEIWPATDHIPYNYQTGESDEGKMNIKDGDGFKVRITTMMYVNTKTYKQKAVIEKVLSEKEEQENAKKFLDSIEKLNPPDKRWTPDR